MVKLRPAFSLAEVIVAMTLLSVGALGVAATALVSVQAFTRAELHARALRTGEQVLDSLLLLSSHSAGQQIVHPARISWTAADSSGAITVSIWWPNRPRVDLVGQR